MRRAKIGIGDILLGVALMGGLAFFYVQLIRPQMLFSEERRAIERLLHRWWENRPPPGINAHCWEQAWILAYNGFGNVCFSPSHVSLREMRRLKADLEAKMHQPATLASLRWLWDRLAETGPHGKEYITRMTPLLDDVLEQLAPPGAAADPQQKKPAAAGKDP